MAPEAFKRKLSAILSADVEGYSRLMGEDEDATVRTLTAYRELMSTLIQKHRGRVVDSPGDNLLAEFGSVVDAVRCAVEIQEELRVKNAELPENRRMAFRIGINLGDVVEEDERIYGDGVNVAARIEGLTEGGGICISRNVHEQVKNKLSLEYEYLGEHNVKNIMEPVSVYKILKEPEADGAKISKVFELPDKPSIAVLPFINMSGDLEQEYFSDGITEDIITDLSKISGLFVIARNSVFTFKGKTVKVRDVGRELGIRYVLEGSVRKSKNRIRITAQLIDATTEGHLWAERYDRDLDDIFDIQDEVTRKIVSTLSVKLKEDEQKRLARKGTEDIKAYDFVLRGAEYLSKYTKVANAYAQQMFEKSINLDPKYAMAYSLMSLTHLLEWIFGWSQDPKSLERAFKLGQEAVSLDDSLAGAHLVLGMVHMWKKQHEKSIDELEMVLSLEPNNADGYAMLGNAFTWAGRFEEAIESVEKAIRLNPYHPAMYQFRLGQAYGLMGDHEKAVEVLKTALNQDPKLLPVHAFLAFVYMEMGRKKEARAQMAEYMAQNPDYSQDVIRETFPLKDHVRLESIVESLRKAGLK